MATKLIAPRTGEGVEELTVTSWLKQVGDQVEEMESIVEIETDKVVTELPSPVSGTLLRIDVPQGGVVKVGGSMGLIGDPDENIDESDEGTTEPKEEKAEPEQEVPTDTSSISEEKEEKQEEAEEPNERAAFISPLVRKMLDEHSLEPEQIEGTGRGGRITKQDVEKYLATPKQEKVSKQEVEPSKPKPTPAPHSSSIKAAGNLIPHTSTRKQIAAHMVESKQTSPHVLTVMEADMTRVLAHRKANKAQYAEDGVNLTLTAYFIKAMAKALEEHKSINATWTEEGLFVFSDINIGMAVALGNGGLIVPVIKQAQNLSLKGIAAAINDLSSRARSKKLSPDEVREGTFTLTNHGTGGSLFAMPIINQPQLGILGTGSMQKRAVVVTDAAGNDSIAIRPMVYLSFVFDHRAIDGESADNFLFSVKKALENWQE
ncbi:MAG TPA: 2-oxo acid dehydrogenase subunit E2 [Chloroflexi bacterium]|jgi:2-oxoglutarate dehydrogenase E2 component (dihydrolipoamide succinyltransferase)|nr:2-oxo acid dehydrogenase subunit E2 [Chloroflexota bacterium]